VLAELYELVAPHLTEKQRRLLAGAGARALGRLFRLARTHERREPGSVAVGAATGCNQTGPPPSEGTDARPGPDRTNGPRRPGATGAVPRRGPPGGMGCTQPATGEPDHGPAAGLAALSATALPAARAVPGTTERVSVASDGTQGNHISGRPGAPVSSIDGRLVVFFSAASNLVAGDTNGCTFTAVSFSNCPTSSPTPASSPARADRPGPRGLAPLRGREGSRAGRSFAVRRRALLAWGCDSEDQPPWAAEVNRAPIGHRESTLSCGDP
jgi:hypothetical protein